MLKIVIIFQCNKDFMKKYLCLMILVAFGCGLEETETPMITETDNWKVKICNGSTCVDPSLIIYKGHSDFMGPIFVQETVEQYYNPDVVLPSVLVDIIPQMCPWDISCRQTAFDGFFACVAKQKCDPT